MQPLENTILPQLQACKQAAPALQRLPNAARQQLLLHLADVLQANTDNILQANAADLKRMAPINPLYDRLQLTAARIYDIANATRQVAQLPDPTGKVLRQHVHANGLHIATHTVPLGVVGAIYEARPNVTIDIAALCLRSGNAVVLKGGSDAQDTNACLTGLLHGVLTTANLPVALVTLLPPEREHLPTLLTASAYVDVLIPRGSQSLIDFVRRQATVPTIETGAGVCHTYVHQSARLPMAAAIVVNAKTQRPSVCNALDTILVDAAVATDFLPLLIPGFLPHAVGIFADAAAYAVLQQAGYPHLQHSTPAHYGMEYLSQQCSIKVVANEAEALAHIAAHSSRHSEAIVCEDFDLAQRFLQEVDAAAVYHNASTRFTDGGEFGLGAELGISTQKLHARGPFALEKLVCEKWVVTGTGQVR